MCSLSCSLITLVNSSLVCGPYILTGCDGHLDIVLVIDTSDAVRVERLPIVLNFLSDVVMQFDVQRNGTRFGAVTYGGGGIGQRFSLGTYQTQQDVIIAVQRLPFIGGSTRLSAALEYLVRVYELIIKLRMKYRRRWSCCQYNKQPTL
jgi:von Willebrand factor type A domain